jgi:hypothetical protein
MKKYFLALILLPLLSCGILQPGNPSAAYQITTDEVAQSINHATCPEKNVSRNGNVN